MSQIEGERANARGLCAGYIYADGNGGTMCSRKATELGKDGLSYCWQHRKPVPAPPEEPRAKETGCIICGKGDTERLMVEGQFEDVHRACLDIDREPITLNPAVPTPSDSRKCPECGVANCRDSVSVTDTRIGPHEDDSTLMNGEELTREAKKILSAPSDTPEPPRNAQEDCRTLLLSFIGSLTLCDHMGDVSDDVSEVLRRLNIEIDWTEWGELGNALGKMGVTTLYGTSLASEPDDEE